MSRGLLQGRPNRAITALNFAQKTVVLRRPTWLFFLHAFFLQLRPKYRIFSGYSRALVRHFRDQPPRGITMVMYGHGGLTKVPKN